jgi:hypothetical protein
VLMLYIFLYTVLNKSDFVVLLCILVFLDFLVHYLYIV